MHDNDIGRLDVQVKNVASVHVGECRTNVDADAQSVRYAYWSAVSCESSQGWSIQILQQRVRRWPSATKESDNVRMREVGENSGLARSVGFRAIELAYHRAPGLVVPHEIDGRIMSTGINHIEHGQEFANFSANAQPGRLPHPARSVGASCAANNW